METKLNELDDFIAISVPLTGYSKVELQTTGLCAEYLKALNDILGATLLKEWLSVATTLLKDTGGKAPAVDKAIRQQLLASLKYGPITRNVIQLWYWGSWLPLPKDWVAAYGKGIKHNDNYFISPAAYKEGLVWKAMGGHPQGAKQPGFGSWEVAPLSATAEVKH